jgi:wobble nucleotide-excising tRNase
MLERFESVRRVGLFEDYSHSPGSDLGEVSLIYGENGVGKSTLAAILDSLRERNAGEIIRRRSLPGDVAPSVAVSLSGKIYIFDGRDWDDQPPHDTLDVFYPGFVTRNVHATTTVDPDHRRNFCELVLGRKAIEKVVRLAQADNDGRSALAEIRAIEKELQLLVKKPDTLETFLGLPNDAKIDEHLEKVRAELKQAQSKDAILARAIPKAVTLPTVNRNAITALMEKSIDGIGADVAAVVRAHIKQHLDDDGENWLAYGARLTGMNNECPFCAQDIAESNLVATIRSYFSAEYRAYTGSLSQEIQTIRDQLGTAAFAQIRAAFAAQAAVAAQWADEMPIDQSAVSATLSETEAVWKSAAAKLRTIVSSKLAKPLDKITPALAEEALTEYESAVAMLVDVNDILTVSGKKAQERKAALSNADTAEIEQRLRRLENQKIRFEPLAQEQLAKRNALIETRTKLDAEKTVLKKEIDEHASRVVGKYQAGINYYLAHFGCDIRIESIEPKFPSGKASVQYTLKAHGHKIELGLSTAEPCFETVLSEGDKYTLALSFFFARLKDHSDLNGRIVVLDDPVNSLGSSRRTLIEGVIRDLRVRGAQVVVLTHDERLAAMIWRDKKLNNNIVALQVERTNQGSQLQAWDIERATQSEYVEHYLTLRGFLDSGGDHKPASSCIRPYLEQRLRHLFPGPPLLTRDTLGQMIAKVRASNQLSPLHALHVKLPELEAINEASLPSHHATDDVPGMDPLTAAQVRIFAQKALDVLG